MFFAIVFTCEQILPARLFACIAARLAILHCFPYIHLPLYSSELISGLMELISKIQQKRTHHSVCFSTLPKDALLGDGCSAPRTTDGDGVRFGDTDKLFAHRHNTRASDSFCDGDKTADEGGSSGIESYADA